VVIKKGVEVSHRHLRHKLLGKNRSKGLLTSAVAADKSFDE